MINTRQNHYSIKLAQFVIKIRTRIYSGKKHQIRIHALSMGNPLVSDPKYIDEKTLLENKQLVLRLFLHNIYYKYIYDGEEK